MNGEVLVRVLSENPSRFEAGSELLVGKDADSAMPRRVDGSRFHQDRLLLHFEGIQLLEEAEPLREQMIFVPAGELAELGQDEYWEHQLVGLTVLHRNGDVLGELAAVIDRPAQDLWSISTPSGEVLFPAARPLVVSVDIEGGTVVIDPPEGLFEP